MTDWPTDPPRRETFAEDAMTHLRQSQAAKVVPKYPFEGIFMPGSPSEQAMPIVWGRVLPAIPNLVDRINACYRDESQQGWRVLTQHIWNKLAEVDRAVAYGYEQGHEDYRWVESLMIILGGWLAATHR